MTRDLFQKAEDDLTYARFGLGTGEERHLQLAAYHIQQALEKTLKQLYIEQGVQAKKTHSLVSLLLGLPNYNEYFSDEIFDTLQERAPLMTEWESKTRYEEGYLVGRRMVLKNLVLVSNVLNHVMSVVDAADNLNDVGKIELTQTTDSGIISHIKFE